MRLYFTSDSVKALKKAGCKSLAFQEEVWRGKEIDTRHLDVKDWPIIKQFVREPKNWEHIENRRILRKMQAVEKLREKGPKKAIIRKVEVLAEAIRDVVAGMPHKWLFLSDGAFGALVPYFVTQVTYHPPENHGDHRVAAKVSVKMAAMLRGKTDDRSLVFERNDLGKKVADVLAGEDALLETPEMVKQHEADLVKYRKEAPLTGTQFVARGKGTEAGNSRWSRDRIEFEQEGVPSKVVMDDELDQGESDGYSNTAFWNDMDTTEEAASEGEDSYALPVHPIVRVFDLGDHIYADTHIGNLEQYKYDTEASKKLVLPESHKELIDTLTGRAIQKMEDIISGKAVGIIILCSGKPGTGKTLTAEVYSEAAQLPLYTVQCSQLGTNSEELEEKLSEVLKRAARWKAILLIDEADVYIHERGHDIDQNAIVGVFLRLLEYYNGILFMTTNRVTIVDDAILSRVTAHVRYEVAEEDTERLRLWGVLAQQYGVEHLPLKQCMKAFPKVSGRSIRQLIRLARFKADRQNKRVTVDMLKWAAKFHDFTELEEEKKDG